MPESKPMRIAHANTFYDDKKDHLDDPTYPSHHGYGRFQLRERGHTLIEVPEGESGLVAKLWNKARLLGDWDKQWYIWKHRREIDCIYSGHQYFLLVLGLLRRFGLFKVPIVASLHRSYGTGFLRRLFVNCLLDNYDGLISVFPPIQQAMLESHPRLEQKMYLAMWGNDYAAFDRIDIPNTTIQSAYFSSGKTYRTYDPVIAGFSGLDAELRFYYGELNQEAAERAKQGDLPENVRYVEFDYSARSLKREVSVARAVIIPIASEKLDAYANGFGVTSMLDAFVGGRPIIMSNGRYGYKELEELGAGILVDADDPNSWRAAVEYLENNPEEAEAMAAASRKLGREVFNIERFTDHLEFHLRKVMEQNVSR